MPDWGASMQQTFEYYTVDPGTWRDDQRITTVTKSTVDRDSDSETLGSASIEATESLGECYVRIYLITIQNGKREKHPLGTFLVQTPSTSFDARLRKSRLMLILRYWNLKRIHHHSDTLFSRKRMLWITHT